MPAKDKKEKKKETSSSSTVKKKSTSSSSEPAKKKKKTTDKDPTFVAIAKQFNKAQKSHASHDKCIEVLAKLHEENYSAFLQKFFEVLHPVLLVSKNEKPVELIIKFIGKFCEYTNKKLRDSTENFDVDLMYSLLGYANATDKTIRMRTAQIIAEIMDKITPEDDVDVDFINELKEKYVGRLRDKVPGIRLLAILVLYKFQEPITEPEITNEFIRLMKTDTNKDVRKEAVKRIYLLKQTLSSVLEKIKDVKEDVRAAAYEKIFSAVKIKNFSIQQRESIISFGLKERNTSVREQVEKFLIEKWFQENDNNIEKFLNLLDVTEYEETCEKIIKLILTKKDKSDKLVLNGDHVDSTKLTPEMALFWRCKCEYLINQKQSIEEILPSSITDFVHLIINYIKSSEDFIVKQLLMLSKYLDYSDEVGRTNIHSLLSELLSVFQAPETHVKEIIEALKSILPNQEDFQTTVLTKIDLVRTVASGISSEQSREERQRREIEKKEKIRSLEERKQEIFSKITILTKEKDQLAKKEEYLEAKKKRDEIQELKSEQEKLQDELCILKEEDLPNDIEEICMWLRALHITSQFILQSDYPIDISQFIYLLDDLVLQTLSHTYPYLRMMSITVLGQFCALGIDIAKEHIDKLFNMLSVETDTSCINAILEAIFDILLIHSAPKIFSKTEMKGKMDKVKNIFSNVERQIRATTVEGFAKLLLSSKLDEEYSKEVLSDMILLLFSNVTSKDNRLRQCLTVFLPAYSYSLAKNMKLVGSIVMDSLRRVVHSKKNSYLSQVNVAQLLSYLAELTNPDKLIESQQLITKPDTLLLHENLALNILFEILINPQAKESEYYCKQLSSLKIFDSNKRHLRKIKLLLEKAIKKIDHKPSIKNLEKFLAIIEQTEKNDENPEVIDDEAIEEEINNQLAEKEVDLELFLDELDEKEIQESTTPEGTKRFERTKNTNPSELKVNLIEIGEEKSLFSTPKKKSNTSNIDPSSSMMIDASPIPTMQDPPTPLSPLIPDIDEVDVRKSNAKKKSVSGSSSAHQYESEGTDDEELGLLSSSDDEESEKPLVKEKPKKKISFASPESSPKKSTTTTSKVPQRKSSVKDLKDEISKLLELSDDDIM
ncbi:predicted protein [Naegleria gruberi]|uniref:Predicted protein n=1 Tax=Naegleria gruberi TaxID=5762 RepID=D2VJD3_NAEGR|nr:uncharacterized protein NAEGRDRAFT_68997 [Naegleria gruberi]EFC43019.1 predicted protein [Naegleria gruberi]|eukprot:XP_002675763.1 predicted protein [Naegleria gruberi strain NEG-M]